MMVSLKLLGLEMPGMDLFYLLQMVMEHALLRYVDTMKYCMHIFFIFFIIWSSQMTTFVVVFFFWKYFPKIYLPSVPISIIILLILKF